MTQPETKDASTADETSNLRGLLENNADADVLREMIGSAAERRCGWKRTLWLGRDGKRGPRRHRGVRCLNHDGEGLQRLRDLDFCHATGL